MKIKVEYGIDGMNRVYLIDGVNKIVVSPPIAVEGLANGHAIRLGQILNIDVEDVQKVENTYPAIVIGEE